MTMSVHVVTAALVSLACVAIAAIVWRRRHRPIDPGRFKEGELTHILERHVKEHVE